MPHLQKTSCVPPSVLAILDLLLLFLLVQMPEGTSLSRRHVMRQGRSSCYPVLHSMIDALMQTWSYKHERMEPTGISTIASPEQTMYVCIYISNSVRVAWVAKHQNMVVFCCFQVWVAFVTLDFCLFAFLASCQQETTRLTTRGKSNTANDTSKNHQGTSTKQEGHGHRNINPIANHLSIPWQFVTSKTCRHSCNSKQHMCWLININADSAHTEVLEEKHAVYCKCIASWGRWIVPSLAQRISGFVSSV